MPHSKQAKKRLRQSVARNSRNRSLKSAMKSHVKRFLKAVEAGDVELAQKELPEAMQKLDKAAKRNVIHKNAAARKISRLSKKLNKLQKPEEPASE